MDVSIILPAYNEAGNIRHVLERMPKKYNVIVVDDGSTDNTADITESMGFRVVRLSKNMGKGRACIEGVMNSKNEFNIFIDSDGQLDISEIPKFESALKEADIVIGQRRMKDIPIQRRISNIFARQMIYIITGRRYSDVLCGFRGVKKSAFQKLDMKKGNYYFESEMIIEASRKGMEIRTVDVSVDYTVGSRMSFAKSLQVAGWLLRLALKKMVTG